MVPQYKPKVCKDMIYQFIMDEPLRLIIKHNRLIMRALTRVDPITCRYMDNRI